MVSLLSELTKAYSKEYPGEPLPASITNVDERQALRAFETGIRSEQLRMLSFLNKSKTLSEAVLCATTYESRNPKKGTSQSHQSSSSHSSSAPTHSATTNSNKPTCENCKKFGHIAQNCRSRPIIKTETPEILCNYCKLPGHIISDCQVRKQNNLKKYGNENWAPPRSYVNHVQTNLQHTSDQTTSQLGYSNQTNFQNSGAPNNQPNRSAEYFQNTQNQVNVVQSAHLNNQSQVQGNCQLRAVAMETSPRIEDLHDH